MANGLWSRIILAVIALFRITIVTAIIIIVAEELYRVTVYFTSQDGLEIAYPAACLLGGTVSEGDVCQYTLAVCGLSLAVLTVGSLFLCITCDACGLGPWIKAMVEAFQATWWVIASIVIADKTAEANSAELPDGSSLPKAGWRNAVAVLAWVTAVLSAAALMVCLSEGVKRLVECCGCFRKREEKRCLASGDQETAQPSPRRLQQQQEQQQQQQQLSQATYTGAPPAAQVEARAIAIGGVPPAVPMDQEAARANAE